MEDWQEQRQSPLEATQGMTFNPHDERHGDVPCATCHDAEPEPTMFCATCHNNAEVPDGWAAAEMPGAEER